VYGFRWIDGHNLELLRSLAAANPQTSKISSRETMAERNNDCEKVTLVTEAFNDLWC
jgi:hypothetical protein